MTDHAYGSMMTMWLISPMAPAAVNAANARE